MVREYPSTTYVPEEEDAERKKESQKVAEDGVTVWREQKERMLQQKQSEQREVYCLNLLQLYLIFFFQFCDFFLLKMPKFLILTFFFSLKK